MTHKILLALSFLRKNRTRIIITLSAALFTCTVVISLVHINTLNANIAGLNEKLALHATAAERNEELARENTQLENENETLEIANTDLTAANGELERLNGDLSKKFDGLSKPN